MNRVLRGVMYCAGVMAAGAAFAGGPIHPQAITPADSYINGYAAALVRYECHVDNATIVVRDGVVQVRAAGVSAQERERIRAVVRHIAGVKAVYVNVPTPGRAGSASAGAPTAATGVGTAPMAGASTANLNEPPLQTPSEKQANVSFVGWGPPDNAPVPLYREPTGAFPVGTGNLFAPLLADPRWPGMAASYQHFSPYHPISGLKDVVQVSIGDTLPFLRANLPWHIQVETGMQANVFAFFNMDTAHSDLQNTDYLVGGYAALRRKNISLLVRYYHQSSHLGDELLLNEPQYQTLREKISYEEANAIVSFDFYHRMFRVYAGVGYLGDVEPSNLGHWRFHYGAEFHGLVFAHSGSIGFSPVAGADFKNWSQANYDTEVSLRAGLQMSKHRFYGPQMQFLIEYYIGHDQNGQFFTDQVQFVGVGVHYYF